MTDDPHLPPTQSPLLTVRIHLFNQQNRITDRLLPRPRDESVRSKIGKGGSSISPRSSFQ